MAAGDYLVDWVREALVAVGGKGTIVDVCKALWRLHESDLRAMGDEFYTWQYDVRWAAHQLRNRHEARLTTEGRRSVWELT